MNKDTKSFSIDVNTSKATSNTASLNSQLKEIQKSMTDLIVAGKENSEEFNDLAKQAGALKDAIGDAQQHIKAMADDTRGLNNVLDVTKSGLATFGLIQSAMAGLGMENEKMIKTIKTLQAAQTALNSVQQLQQTLMDKSSATYKLLNASIVTYTGTSKAAAIATKALNVALKSIGIGLVVGAIATIAAHLDDIKESLSGILPFLKDETKELEKQKELEEARNTKIKERMKLDKELSEAIRKLRIDEGQEAEVLQEAVDIAEKHLKTLEEQYNVTRNIVDLTKSRVGQEGNLERIQREHGLWSEELKAQDEEYQNILKVVKQQKTAWANAVTELNKAEKALKDYNTQSKKLSDAEQKAEQDARFARWEKEGKMRMLQLETEQILQDALLASDKARTEELRKQFEEIAKSAPLLEDEMEEPEDLSWITYSYNDLIKLKTELGTLPDDMELMLEKYEEQFDKAREYIGAGAQLTTEIFSAISYAIDESVREVQKNINKIDKALTKMDKSISKHKDNLSDLYSQLAESEGNKRDALLASIEIERNALKEQSAEQTRLENEKIQQEKKLAIEQGKQQKANLMNDLIQSIANTAISISTSMQAGFPAAIPFIAMAAATGAIQTGIIAAQMSKIKYANGGMLEGPSHERGGIPVGNTGIEVEGGEYIVNKRASKRYLPILEMINDYGNSVKRFANGGEINLPQSDSLRTLSNMNFNPVVSVTDIQKVSSRLNKVRVRS